MQNVEFKAELRDIALARTICKSVGAVFVETLVQTDTYFTVPDARLKKRETLGHATEYVFYSRASRSKPKLSNFTLYTERQAIERFGASPLPVWVIVKKTRDLWVFQGTRIHLDTVESLGSFIEFEALVCPERNLGRCHEIVDALRRHLGPAMGEPIACGYADLLAGDRDGSR